MRGSIEDLPVALEVPEVRLQNAEWGDFNVAFETYHAPFDMAPLLKGLPDDRCQCPHWGYVIKGRFTVNYANRDEVVEAGQAYYLCPGHIVRMEAGTQVVEFSPKESYLQTVETAERNYQAMLAAQQET